MQHHFIKTAIVILISTSLFTGFGFGDLKNKIKPDTEKCKKSSNSKKCKKNERLKIVAKVVVIGIAAKLIKDMLISFKSTETSNEKTVQNKYKKTHKSLPKEPVLSFYESSIKPGDVVKTGKNILIESQLEVVSGTNNESIVIEERISIYDNEDNTKILKSLTKTVNDKTKRSGAFTNNFTFKLPEGMPQGVYPIKSLVIIDDKEFESENNKMQLVLHVIDEAHYEILAFNP